MLVRQPRIQDSSACSDTCGGHRTGSKSGHRNHFLLRVWSFASFLRGVYVRQLRLLSAPRWRSPKPTLRVRRRCGGVKIKQSRPPALFDIINVSGPLTTPLSPLALAARRAFWDE